MKTRAVLFAILGSLLLACPAQAQSITTLFAGGNSNAVGGGNYYDVNVLNPAGLVITGFDINTAAVAGTAVTMNVFTRPGTSVGFEGNPAGWAQVSTGNGVSAGLGLATFIDVADFPMTPGVTGFALNNSNYSFTYTNGNGANQFFSNADLSLTLGSATNIFLAGVPFTPRVWNGTIYYSAVPEPTSLALVGVGLVGLGWRRFRGKK